MNQDGFPAELKRRLSAVNPSAGFAVVVDGTLMNGLLSDWRVDDVQRQEFGGELARVTRTHVSTGLRAVTETVIFPCRSLAEMNTTLMNTGERPLVISRLDSVCLRLRAGDYHLESYSGAWGREFSPEVRQLEEPVTLETTSGRSSSGNHPWFRLCDQEDDLLAGTIAWSGNHVMRFVPEPDGEVSISGGLSDRDFEVVLRPGESLEAPAILLALGSGGDRDATAHALHRWGRYKGFPPGGRQVVEWNHWWPYEDSGVCEDVFRANAQRAVELGVDLVTLDAGWFGPAGDTAWWDYRGDWGTVNSQRFPCGIRALSDHAHGLGLRFGLWCEIEAVGRKASLNTERPDLIATRNGEPLGMVCLGNPDARAWAVDTLDRLIREYALDWVKVDFNVEPGAGCNRIDHGHGRGDGLFRHVQGLYGVLDQVRAHHPGITLEACSSGGLRLDPGLMQHVHCAFLSDPDTPVHNLQLMWGALDMFPPEVLLHWMWSETRGAFQSFDWGSATEQTVDFTAHSAMTGLFGLSHRLPELPAKGADRLKRLISTYRGKVAPLLERSAVYRLTNQPLREGGGDRWCAFQYQTEEDGLLFVFRLAGGEAERRVRLRGLNPRARYLLEWEGDGRQEEHDGKILMSEGLVLRCHAESDSMLIALHRK